MTTSLAFPLIAVSLITASLLAWLGLVVLGLAERRTWGVWLAGVAMLGGAGLFGFHTLLISEGQWGGPLALTRWPLVWAGGALLPGAWYAVVLWHVGLLEYRGTAWRLRLHQLALLALLAFFAAEILAVLLDPSVRGNPLVLFYAFEPSMILAGPAITNVPLIGRLPWMAVAYTVPLVACTALAVDALRHPAPSRRMMGDAARERARPWLTGASLAWLAVSLLVCGAMLAYMPKLLRMRVGGLTPGAAHTALLLDLVASLLVLLAVALVGQAIVSYEIFTGTALPRRGLRRSWGGALLLAGITGAVLAGIVQSGMPPAYGALLVALLVIALYAAFTGQTVRARERAMAELRAAAAGPSLYRALLAGAAEDDGDAFGTLCTRVLGVSRATLLPLGPLAPLLPPLAHPPGAPLPADARDLAAQATPQTLCLPADLARHAGAQWAVPLWGDRGLHGLLLLGPKADGSLYAEEEMEAARAAGERLLDARAGTELARRLVQVQRTHLAESQVADRRTRRVLHDDVLPQVHAAMLATGAGQADAAVAQLAELHKQIADLLHALPTATVQTLADKGVLGALRLCVESELAEAFTRVEWEIDPAAAAAIAALPPLAAEVLYGAAREAVRNTARYAHGGDETRALILRIGAALAGEELRLTVADDGVGAGDVPSTGAGHGMALHGTLLAILGGAWMAERDGGTRVTLTVPASGG